MRVAYNWAVEQAASNLAVRRDEREPGVAEEQLTPALSWSKESFHAAWRVIRDQTHPWRRDVSIRASAAGSTTPRWG
jgi:putative transposase